MKRNLGLLIGICGALFISTALAAGPATKTKVIYRYKNNQGVTVMDSSIPPQYVSKGYEVVSQSGKVLKVVPPSPKAEDAERLKRERQEHAARQEADIQLRRSYSNVADIDSAKQRNLQSLRGNIGILQANLSGVRSKLQAAQAQAAAVERSGRVLHDDALKNIASLEQEEKDILTQIRQRETEYQSVSDRFDEDRARFVEITKAEITSSVTATTKP